MHTKSLRIAMWSGPRNISTALLRAWENRPDTVVVDEPFYAVYLDRTGVDHPGREEIVAAYETDPLRVIDDLTGRQPAGRPIFYQKHMTHHMLPDIPLDWLAQVHSCFLIRHPREVIHSYIRIRPEPAMADVGFERQLELFNLVRTHVDPNPPVVDSRDILENPRRILGRLCERLGIPFDERMLTWPAGSRPTDGLWARYWYAAVEKSTGFTSYRPDERPVPDHLGALLRDCTVLYEEMARHRIR